MVDLDEMQKKLKAIAEVVNAFKSESVQLRVVEVLLAQLGGSPAKTPTSASASAKKTKRRKPSAKAAPTTSDGVGAQSKTAARKPARTSASPGAYAMITQLLGDGFFKTPRTISDIVAHCGTSKGHHYKANECSPSLLRLLRDAKLTRKKNKDGQYEYTQA
jgi:hypothetical protein